MKVKKLRFYSNGTEDDREAFQLLMGAGIPIINFGPISEEETPILEYWFWKFQGLKSIKRFIEDNWKTGKLPPTDLFDKKEARQ